MGLRGATVARLTPDQKVACSNHVGVKTQFFFTGRSCVSQYQQGDDYLTSIYLLNSGRNPQRWEDDGDPQGPLLG